MKKIYRSILLAVVIALISVPVMAEEIVCSNSVNRVAAMSNALVNGTATSQQKLSLAAAFAVKYRSYVIAKGYDPDNLTNAEAACLVMIKTIAWVQSVRRQNHPGLNTAKAAVVTAEEGIVTAAGTAASDTESEWPSEDLEDINPEP